MADDFRNALDEIKLRAPIEEVVRERVGGLTRRGALYEACCPFHEERTPSFKVDPRRGTWHCFGACSEGGDQISFIERFCSVSFMEAVEILASRTGVEVPRKGGRRGPSREESDRARAALERAVAFYAERLSCVEGRGAREYLERRGLERNTLEAFGVGWAPAGGQALVDLVRAEDLSLEVFEEVGLVRRNDSGRPYDFFRGRLVIPIRDLSGRAVGFGARRLEEGDGPKYINTPQTALFNKSELVYGLDRALGEVRRTGHLVLVEGYTDVMAAHQVGIQTVGAVLGTATTDRHAALVRRTGARRVSLVFDGDEAGRRAAFKALHGLLPLEVALDVAVLEGGADPCDLLVGEGAAPFLAILEQATGWFDFVVEGLDGLRGIERSKAVDEILGLVARVSRPVHRSELFDDLSRRTGLAPEVLRAQWRTRAGARDPRPARAAEAAPAPATPSASVDPRVIEAWRGLVGALLLDESLVPALRPHAPHCPDPLLGKVLETVLDMVEDEEVLVDPGAVISALGEHPARALVVGLAESARQKESARALLEGELAFLARLECSRREDELRDLIAELERNEHAADETGLEEVGSRIAALQEELMHSLRMRHLSPDASR
ncbi:MAG: DNA primase [Planctomycetota bacterium]|nr:DNA primase [Planctomycetota bacterium]MDP6764167.1 DNA primase [Planctomycetota bacterium]MDP6989638.1 DNA primase [Planctomycetota bacterium]